MSMLIAATYGSDHTGLIVGYRFSGGGPATQVDGVQAVA